MSINCNNAAPEKYSIVILSWVLSALASEERPPWAVMSGLS